MHFPIFMIYLQDHSTRKWTKFLLESFIETQPGIFECDDIEVGFILAVYPVAALLAPLVSLAQHSNDGDAVLLLGMVTWSHPLGILQPPAGSFIYQHSHQRDVAKPAGQVKRSHATVVLGINVGSSLQQICDVRQSCLLTGCIVKRCATKPVVIKKQMQDD